MSAEKDAIIADLSSTILVLREALTPFANRYEYFGRTTNALGEPWPDSQPYVDFRDIADDGSELPGADGVYVGQLRVAAQALSTPEPSSVSAIKRLIEAAKPERTWILWFADQDVDQIMIAGYGAEAAAREAYKRKKTAWTCRLYQEMTPAEVDALDPTVEAP